MVGFWARAPIDRRSVGTPDYLREGGYCLAMGGLYLNAYSLTFVGEMSLWQLAADPEADKLQVRACAGCSVWQDEAGCWWSAREPADSDAELRLVPTLPVTSLGLFVLREALVDMAEARGYEAWVRWGEVDVLGLLPAQEEDAFVVEPQLNLRAVREQYIDVHAMLQFRQRMRWRVAGHLGDPQLHRHAGGGWAVRLSGTGPRRARIARVSSDELVLEVGTETISVSPQDYALVASVQNVAAWRGNEVLRRLQIASGTFTAQGRRNLYAVKARFSAGADMVRTLGLQIPLPGQAQVTINPQPIEVQVRNS